MNREFAKKEFASLASELDFLTEDQARRRAESVLQATFGGESAGEVRARAAADYARLVAAREDNRKLRRTLRDFQKLERGEEEAVTAFAHEIWSQLLATQRTHRVMPLSLAKEWLAKRRGEQQ